MTANDGVSIGGHSRRRGRMEAGLGTSADRPRAMATSLGKEEAHEGFGRTGPGKPREGKGRRTLAMMKRWGDEDGRHQEGK